MPSPPPPPPPQTLTRKFSKSKKSRNFLSPKSQVEFWGGGGGGGSGLPHTPLAPPSQTLTRKLSKSKKSSWVFILKPYTKLSLPKKIWQHNTLGENLRGWGGSSTIPVISKSTKMYCINITPCNQIIIIPNICFKNNINITWTYLKIKYLSTNQ